MNTHPDYTRWFARAGEAAAPVSAAGSVPFKAGDIIASGSGNLSQEPPTEAVSDDIVINIDVPWGEDEQGAPVAIQASIEATFSVEDWGYVEIDGERIISMTSDEEPPGPLNGHYTWAPQTSSLVVMSGSHRLVFHYENIRMDDPMKNKLVCEYAYRVVALEDGGRKDKEECGCSDTGCSQEGGNPPTRSGRPAGASSSAGSHVGARLTEDGLYWSCNTGVLRGLGAKLGGKVVLEAGQLGAELASPAALQYNHPATAELQLPESGVTPGSRLEIRRGNRIIALRYYSDGSIAPIGVDTGGSGVVSLLPGEEGNPATLRWQEHSGEAWEFSLGDGALLRYTSAEGVIIEDVSSLLGVLRSGGVLQQIWSCWDGLLNIENVTSSGYRLALYTPEQVNGQDNTSGLFTLAEGAAPFKHFTLAWDGEALSITESAPQRQDIVNRWQQSAEGTWIHTTGTGNEAICTTRTRTPLEAASATTPAVWQQITTVSRGGETASCSCDIYQDTPVGQLLLARTEGYGSPAARTTQYEYDGRGNEVRRRTPDGSVWENYYDAAGRLVRSVAPWRDGSYAHITHYSYLNSSTAERFSSELDEIEQLLRPAGGGVMTTLLRETHRFSESGGVKREEIRTTATGSPHTQLEITETWTGEAPVALDRGRLRMRQAADGVQRWYSYTPDTRYGALYTISEETRVAGGAVAGQSRRSVRFINAAGNTVREEEYILLSDGLTWSLLDGSSHYYDTQNRRVATQRDNGRSSSREYNCAAEPLREVDEDGVQTDYTYNSARQLTETSRSAVYDGETCITPETITEYIRNASGQILSSITRTGPLTTTRHTRYDAAGRIISQSDELGRETTTSHSADGLASTVTTPAGATLTTELHPDGSLARISGSAQREILYTYSVQNGYICEMQKLADGSIISQTLRNGFGEVVVQAQANTQGGFICTRSEFNAAGQLVKQYRDTGVETDAMAPTLYEYGAMGHLLRETLALAEEPDAGNSPVTEYAYGAESTEEGVLSLTTTTRYNAAGQPLTSTQKQLISQLSPTLESKVISVSERGLTSTQWSVYNTDTKRTQYNSVPASDITAETVVVDGFVLQQKDTAGITTSATRQYTASGIIHTHTDGRGNTTTTQTDIAGRTISVTDAAGNVTTTAYDAHHDAPATITDALGNTTCYRYDERGRKVAEWGTAVQPTCFGYDEADHLVSLTTFRHPQAVISTAPADTAGDVTSWTYDPATGLELSKTYADNSSVVKTYDAFNRLATETNARGIVKTYHYEPARGLLLGTTYSDTTTPRSYAYNHLGQLTQVSDAAGTRSIGYNQYGEQETDTLVAGGKTHLITETRDAMGRSTGYVYSKDGSTQQTVTTGYGADGRIATAGFLHGGVERQFSYEYLSGTNLLQKLTLPSNMTLTQSYEPQRDLPTSMLYKRGSTAVAQRSYSYDALSRPLTRSTARNRQTINDSFGYNTRSELTSATVNNGSYAYEYDNIGNRTTAQENVEEITSYQSNALNQYTALSVDGFTDFIPTYDADGNQTRVQTRTGIWAVSYDAENRPTDFTKVDSSGSTSIHCEYDSMGRRAAKQVTVNGNVTLHQRYLYRGYLQIACCDLTRGTHPCLWLITWDPTQPVATRPLAIQKDATWYTYGWDLTKNICEVYGPAGYIRTAYTYTPYGEVSANGDREQPIQWSSEYNDTELGLIYYNYRHYNPLDGRWLGRDRIEEMDYNNLYCFVYNQSTHLFDLLGMAKEDCNQENIGSYKNLRVIVKVVTLMKEEGYILADTSNFSLSKHIEDAVEKYIKNKGKEQLDDFLLKRVDGYGRLKNLYDELSKYERKMRGGISPDLFGEAYATAGGVIKHIEINVETEFCCCSEGKFKFSKSSASATTPDYNINLKAPDSKSIKQIKKLSEHLVNGAQETIKKLWENKCKS